MEEDAEIDLERRTDAAPRSHDAHAAQEAARGRQPVPAHGQRRHDPRRALPAPPAGARLGADGADRQRRAGPAAEPPGVRVVRAPVPWPEAAARRRPAQHARQPLGLRARPVRRLGRAGRARRAGELLRDERFDAIFSSSPRPSVHLVAAALARLARPALAGRLPRPLVHLPVPHVPDARRTGPPTPASRPGRCAAPPPSPRSTGRSSTTSSRGTRGSRGRAHVLPNGFDRAERADDVTSAKASGSCTPGGCTGASSR